MSLKQNASFQTGALEFNTKYFNLQNKYCDMSIDGIAVFKTYLECNGTNDRFCTFVRSGVFTTVIIGQ